MPRYFRSDRLLRVWINESPDSFMPMKHQLNLIRLRESHPKANIVLVISLNDPETKKPFLTAEATEQCRRFCDQFRIQMIDVSELESALADSTERDIFSKICLEVNGARSKMGGNLAAASDLLRTLFCVLSKGIYSDFDTLIDTSELPEIVEVETDQPILCSGCVQPIKQPNGRIDSRLESNNDILVLTFPDQACVVQDKILLSRLSRIQKLILKNYRKPREVLEKGRFSELLAVPEIRAALAIFLETNDVLSIRRFLVEKFDVRLWMESQKRLLKSTLLEKLHEHLLLSMPSKTALGLLEEAQKKPELMRLFLMKFGFSIDYLPILLSQFFDKDALVRFFKKDLGNELFLLEQTGIKKTDLDLRQYELAMRLSTDEFLQEIYQSHMAQMMGCTVTNMTGPDPWSGLYYSTIGEVTVEALAMLRKISIHAQVVLNKKKEKILLSRCLRSMQIEGETFELPMQDQMQEDVEHYFTNENCSDESWLEHGKLKLQQSGQAMSDAARVLQHAYRQHRRRRASGSDKSDTKVVTMPTTGTTSALYHKPA